MTNLNRIATYGHSGAAVLNAGLGGADCTRAIERTLRSDVILEALTLLKGKIELEDYEPWEYAGYNCGTNRREYEHAIDALRGEAEVQAKDASAEMMFGRVTRSMHKREVLKLCQEYSAKRRGVQMVTTLLLVAGGHGLVGGKLP